MGPVHSSPLKIYYDPASTNSVRVLVYLAEAGIPHETVLVDVRKGEHKAGEFAKMNPRMQVPFMVHGEVRMGESVAIIEYLGRIHPNESLFPTRDAESCAINCMRIAEFHQKLDPRNIMGAVVFQKKTREELGEERVQSLLKELKVWDEYLGGENDYMLGDKISTSDIVIFPNMAVFFWLLGLPEADYPFLAAWYKRMRARPSVAKLEFWDALEPLPEWRVLDRR